MDPKAGWYTLTEWMKTFRPDGVGRIIIEASGQRDVIEFSEIVCDRCNADAAPEHQVGDEPQLYFDGRDTLCAACGREAAGGSA